MSDLTALIAHTRRLLETEDDADADDEPRRPKKPATKLSVMGGLRDKLMTIARRIQAALQELVSVKPAIEFDGRNLSMSVSKVPVDHVVREVKNSLPGTWKAFTTISGNEVTKVFAPAEREGEPYVFVDAEDDGAVVVLGAYTKSDLEEGVVRQYRKRLDERNASVLGSSVGALRALLSEKGEATFQGKTGIWRSTDSGSHIFIPDEGEPMVGKNLTLAQAKAKSGSSEPAKPSKRVASNPAISKFGRGQAEVTPSNWKDKWDEFTSHPKVKKLGHVIQHPYLMAKELVKDPETRQRAKAHIKNAVKKESEATKKLVGTLGRAIKKTPPPVTKDEVKESIHQVVDLVKAGLGVATVGHMAAKGLVKFVLSLFTPVDELVGMAIDHPIRKITKKVFGKEHGLLPSAFYEGPRVFMTVDSLPRAGSVLQEADKTPEALLDEIIDAILDQLANTET